jgi:hypothetical protein
VAKVDTRFRAQILGPGWLWPDLLADLDRGAVAQAVEAVNRISGMPVRVAVSASYYRDMEPGRPYDEPLLSDNVVFEVDGGHLERTERRGGAGLLDDAAQSWTLAELGHALELAPNQDWAWFSVTCGLPFHLTPLQPGGVLPADAWSAAQLWERVLVPWLPWLR